LFEHALDVTEGNYLAHSNLAPVLAAEGQTRAALDHLDRAIAIKGDDPAAFNNRGNVHELLGDLERAAADMSKAIQIKPDYADAYHNRARVYFKLKRFEMAARDLDTLAANAAERGDFEAAVKYETEALALAADEQFSREARRRLELYRTGRTKD
jgi:tetratricopeptide (TPR) repeat protein